MRATLLGLIALLLPGALSAQTVTSTGSGFVVSSKGHILTNAHVVEGCSEINARLPLQGPRKTSVVAVDSQNDLALLDSGVVSTQIATFRANAGVRSGDNVVAVGYPFSSVLASEPKVSTGIVAAMAGINNDVRYLQISAPVQPGNSGGPLFDAGGHVIGIVTSRLNDVKMLEATGNLPQNVNFAIKADFAKIFLESNRVEFESSRTDQPLSAAEINDKARGYTVYIECFGVAPSQPQAPALAQVDLSDCEEPQVPRMPNGTTAPPAVIIAAANAVKLYIALSDVYQRCLADKFDRLERAAKAENRKVDPKIEAALRAFGDENQASKERLGEAYAVTAAAYRAAHPPRR